MGEIRAWHFAPEGKFQDGRPIRRNVRYWAKPKGKKISLFEHGMHGSIDIIDALWFAQGPVICWCEFGGTVVEGGGRLCAEWRRVLWYMDASDLLNAFARQCALQAAKGWWCPYEVWEWLETGDARVRSSAAAAASSVYVHPHDMAAWLAAWATLKYDPWSAAWTAALSALEASGCLMIGRPRRPLDGSSVWGVYRDSLLGMLREAGWEE